MNESAMMRRMLWQIVWQKFRKKWLGMAALVVVSLFVLVGVYAPFLAGSKPIVCGFEGKVYFPLFRYLFFQGFYTKRLDLFFNLMIFTLPLMIWRFRVGVLVQLVAFVGLILFPLSDPAVDLGLEAKRRAAGVEYGAKEYLNAYGKMEPEWAVMPLVSHFHWQEDAIGSGLKRINGKDLVAALIFGVRISLVVGVTAVMLSLLIGIPFGAFAGFYGGKLDIVLSRLLEIWEAMPTFFMLLMVVAIAQSKSIFLVVAVLGFFGWTGFSRFLRAEVLKQRNLSYVEACRSVGMRDRRVLFRHVLPNAIPPLLTLLPFSLMAAITSEAGLSFLGLGEEGSCSWGVLMDEGRAVFPGRGELLWPPAFALTLLLVAIALVGDALRDALDPRT